LSLKRCAALACVGFIVLVVGTQPAVAVSPTLVISQVYGGGGNAGSTFKNDFMEIYNRGSTAVDVRGWSVQYASSMGSTWTRTTLASPAAPDPVLIQPGRYFLVRQAQGAGGTVDLPNADAIGTTAMSATAGKVVLVANDTTITSTTVCPAATDVVDIVGYGSGTTCSETSPTATLSNTTAALRNDQGCTDTDNNSADFAVGSPNPRNRSSDPHLCGAESAPSVTSTAPANSATGVARAANITINFSEPVDVAGSWYAISCGSSGAHTAAQSGGPSSFTLNPDADFAFSETCTVTVSASQVSDQDALDPPDDMAADHTFSFTTEAPPPPMLQISEIQGTSHMSPHNGQLVRVEGVVIAERGSNVWLQDPTPDADSATSEGILVFGSVVANAVVVGDLVRVGGTVTEFRPGCTPSCSATSSAFDNLTITEIAAPGLSATKLGTASVAATVIGSGGRVPPNQVIEDDSSSGNVETSGAFDPAQDGIDFYETLESMLVQVSNPVVVGPRNSFGEILVLADNGAGTTVRTTRGGIVIRDVDPSPVGDYRSGDFNPERIMLDDLFMATPSVDVADGFTTAPSGVMTYDFANFKIAVTNALTAVDGGLEREATRAPLDREIVVGTYNVENLDPTDGSFTRHAELIVSNLRSPDLLAIEEIQDNNGAANDSVTDASATWNALIAAIQAAGGPVYEYRQIDPVDDQDGGQPGGNIRVGFLFRTDRGLSFVDRPGGDSTTPTEVIDTMEGARLSSSPGRVDPLNEAFVDSRKPLAGEFRLRGKKVFVIANHFSSKGGDDPLFGRFQPPVRSSEEARHAQAQVVNDFVDEIKAADRRANVIVLGDINDFEFSRTVEILEGDVLTSLMNTLPQPERYSYVFEGNSQVLDQILVSNNMLAGFPIEYDPVHVNSEFADQASDHDPQVARIDLRGRAPLSSR
jgi:predicted extracellular nuclease